MRIPLTLSFYIGRQFLIAILLAFAGMMLIITLGDMVELIRRTSEAAAHREVPFSVVLEMALLRIPYSSLRILPFAVMAGGMIALTRLTRTQELVVARASGISVWQFLAPAMILVIGIGILFMSVVNPVAAAMLSRFEKQEAKYITGRASLFSVSSSGLWIRQVERGSGEVREHIFHALRTAEKGAMLADVIVFGFGENDSFVSRMDAQSATLKDRQWILHDVTITRPGEFPEKQQEVVLDTDLTTAEIQDSFAAPMTLSFWQLPAFINTLEKAGFSALRHRMYWHSTLASPLLLCAMIFLAAVFSLRLPRRGGVAALIAAGLVTGFAIHFLTNVISALGQSGEMPVVLSAWAPTLIALLVGGSLLLHLEDG